MKIGIEAQRIFRKKKHGMDMVALELVRNLQLIDRENEYVVFVKPDEDRDVLSESSNFRVVELGGGPYPTWEQWALPRAARAHGCDLLHCTSNTAPMRSSTPLVVTLHDIIYLESISLFIKGGTAYQKLGNMYRRWVVPPVIRKSKKVITVSNFEKERIGRFFGMDDDRLVAVYNGVGSHFTPVTDALERERVRKEYGLPERFFFFLGNTDPKKNTPNVLKSMAMFNAEWETPHHLVMLDYDEAALRATLKEIGHPALRDHIHLCGYVPNTELPAIISQAEAFLYPSMRESFGIPILEGMACGVPVITANTSSMPEVAGGAALLVDPKEPLQIRDAMQRVLSDQDLRKELVSKGLERARKFSWQAMAGAVLDIYRQVHQESQSR